MSRSIRVGTRKSLLARVQTDIVIRRIREKFPQIHIEVVPISTKGDERLNQSLGSFGGKGVFTKELEEQLLSKEIDLAVHSAKDMPVILPAGLRIGAVLGRTHTQDLFVTLSKKGTPGSLNDEKGLLIQNLPEGFVVGTGSMRRELQIQALNPGLRVKPIRGNVQTRLDKLAAGEYDAILLAQAGIARLMDAAKDQGSDSFDYGRFSYTPLDTSLMLPAAAQGILAVEARTEDLEDILEAINDENAWEELSAERAFLEAVGGSCNAPAAALATRHGDHIVMDAMYAGDLHHIARVHGSCILGEGEALGRRLAKELLKTKPGRVWLIGAGPGDMGLISVRGLECLRRADVIIYDNLAAAGLLNEAREDAELIYAGKRAGSHYLKQEETNRLIVKYALEGKNVARLKGGDVFIFGRGGEEGLALYEAGLDFEVVPGISSSYAVAAYQGIPVTHRGMASSFHVITGHEDAKKTESVLDYGTLAREEGTLVFLMGLKNLPEICRQLIAHGKDKNTPAAVLSSGTTAHQQMAEATLGTIAEAARSKGIKTPAITLVGEVARLHDKLAWYDRRPMSGKSVLITATKPMADELSRKLSDAGAQPVPLSLIRTAPVEDEAVQNIYETLGEYSWVVFTSRNGVDVFFEGLKKRRLDLRFLARQKFAAIGDGTAKALERYGIYCDYIPKEYTSAAMAKDWVPALNKNEKVLLLRARQSSPVLPKALQEQKIPYRAVALYETVEDWRKAPELCRVLSDVDYVTLCSATAAEAFYKMTREMSKAADRAMPPIVCIGPVTARAAKALGLKVSKTARVYNIDGIIECIDQAGAGGPAL